jgi:hypothetical protein
VRAGRRIALVAVLAGAPPLFGAACSFDVTGLGSAAPESVGDSAARGDGASVPPSVGVRDAAPNDASLSRDAASPDASLVDAIALDAPTDASDGFDARDAATTLSLRYNVDGVAFVSASAEAAGPWLADPGIGGICGSQVNSVASVYGTNDGPLYVGEVYGDPMTCSIGAVQLPPGAYDVTLYFAEIYFGPGCPGGGGGTGARVFDVTLEGVEVEHDLDVFALGRCLAASNGSGSPVIRKHRVNVADGTLDVSMSASVNNAKISAIRVDGPF